MPLLRSLPTVSSAYLRSHVDNPVDWWTWGEDAFAEARRRNVPVFLSVGYAACHWCHVMAHESFEDPAIGELLRHDFVAIKVDREERPDVDQVYMAATQLLSGHGGWPMSMFLLPDGRPFTGGTYYPPVDRGGQVGFSRLLEAIASAWRERRDDVLRQADAVESGLQREIAFVDHLAPAATALDLAAIRARLGEEIAERTDDFGGTGQPRFPRSSYVRALLASGQFDAAQRALRAMAFEGLYDHIEGGFARYSVDNIWHVPHFEQMLSDQALLARAYFEAAVILDDPEWGRVGLATLERVIGAFAVEGGFASSLDADAGGVEGSHVTWTVEEVRDALDAAGCGELLNATLARWRITSPGLFEGRSIPRLAAGVPFATPEHLEPARRALQAARARRPQPGRDEKVLLEWNAMTAAAMFASRDASFTQRAFDLLNTLAVTHYRDGQWRRTDSGEALATAADLAWLGDACLDAFEASGDDHWWSLATKVADELRTHFWDGELPSALTPDVGAGFFATSDRSSDLFVRPKDLFDGATPSSHAVAARFFARLALVSGDLDTAVIAQRLVAIAQEVVASHPQAVVDLVEAAGFALDGHALVIPGPAGTLANHVRLTAVPRTVLITGSGTSPLLQGRRAGFAYLCRNGVCQLPVATIDDLRTVLAESL